MSQRKEQDREAYYVVDPIYPNPDPKHCAHSKVTHNYGFQRKRMLLARNCESCNLRAIQEQLCNSAIPIVTPRYNRCEKNLKEKMSSLGRIEYSLLEVQITRSFPSFRIYPEKNKTLKSS